MKVDIPRFVTLLPGLVALCLLCPTPAPGAAQDAAAKETADAHTSGQPALDPPGTTPAQAVPEETQHPMDPVVFAQQAAQTDLAEIAMAQLAMGNGEHPSVRKLGEMMVIEHTRSHEALKSIAAEKHIPLPSTLNNDNAERRARLAGLSGDEFDQAYVSEAVAAHGHAVTLFKEAAARCTDGELKAYAAETLPVLEAHLAQIVAIQREIIIRQAPSP